MTRCRLAKMRVFFVVVLLVSLNEEDRFFFLFYFLSPTPLFLARLDTFHKIYV